MKPIHLRNSFLHDHTTLIEHIASWIKPERYLEIGIEDGTNLRKVQNWAHECYAVDIKLRNRNYKSNVKLFEMPSNDFFQNLDPSIKFDMAFIDGDHEKNQVYKDFVNLEHRMIDDGVILMHDSVPMNEGMLLPHFSNNAWEAILKIKNEFLTRWEIVSLPMNPGLTIMRKMPINKQLIWK